ncbi:MAG: gamma-glutamyltransferase [Flavobacteriaceae bacterium TMED68]|nr:MAG: gamma-glutamyltransferase [Flavobacteriaceae bacterium TMED68]|tara:strand:+ start:18597 stop:20285 length:1689 start_codon:yes stop_codon:yes gene_type:complete
MIIRLLIKFTHLTLSLSFLLSGCNKTKDIKAAVVSARKEASDIGISILNKGGSAFDAMIAIDLALTVCFPNAGNISGGGFLVYRTASGEVGSLDYREKAPLNAYEKMYLDENGDVIPEKSTLGGLAVGVPGTVAGLAEIHSKFGSLPWEDLVKPAIDLAINGYIVTEKQEQSFRNKKDDFIKINGENTFYAQNFKAGDTVKNIALAETLKRISKYGAKGFYEGPVAESLVKRVREAGGIITKEDLIKYKPVWRKPLNFKYKNLNIYSMGPPSSGGVCLGQILKMIEPYNIGQYYHNSEKAIQLIVEAERRSYSDRSKYLGDPDFSKIPYNQLISNKYLNNRMNSFSFDLASESKDIQAGKIPWTESEETTHYSILDQSGNAVAVTTTLNGSYGSKVFVEDGGYFLNNEMDDFSIKPGFANMFGLIGSEANSIKPEKRMLSSMTPTIISKDNKLYMILGTPGGSTIITSVLQTILNVYEFDMGIQSAINAPRFHHQWLPDKVEFETGVFDKVLMKKLQDKGYDIKQDYRRVIGRVDAILISKSGDITTGADPRGDDKASHLYY